MHREPAHQHSLRVLEFPRIVERLAALAQFPPAVERCRALLPVRGDELTVRRTRTAEAMRLLDLSPGFALGLAEDPQAVIGTAALGGAVTPEDLLLIRNLLETLRAVRGTLRKHSAGAPFLFDMVEQLPGLRGLANAIDATVSSRGEVLDTASEELGRIRAELRQAHGVINDRLVDLMASPRYRMAVQDPIVTLRDGRYVIPVKADFRGAVRGVVHGASSTGQTIFVEPMAVVDLNNAWREAQGKEEREIGRILRRLAATIGEAAPDLHRIVDALAEVDCALARARLAVAQHATLPAVGPVTIPQSGEPGLVLRHARHPLLPLDAVPLDVELGGRYPCIVITGPNTGGKTVALKTVGLLALMAASGLAIPADSTSRVPLYDAVYADIGDEQSIEQSLSTFGAHTRTIIEILQAVTPDSLVLLDELGAGTDPAEGAALARALLEHLAGDKVSTIATTHHSELKAFAHQADGVRNASMEFDAATLAPTFHLVLDVPGRSNAFEIASRLGMPAAIVSRARGMRPETDGSLDTLVRELNQLRQDALAARRRAEKDSEQAARRREQLDRELALLEATKAEQLEEATESLNRYRRDMEARLKRIAGRLSRLEDRDRDAVTRVQQELDAAAATPPPRRTRPKAPKPATPVVQRTPKVGDTVVISGLGATGTLVSLQGTAAEVRVGSMTARTTLDALRLANREEQAALPPAPVMTAISDRRDLRSELDVRGARAHEIGGLVDQYLHDASLAGLRSIRIVHGKGTGALREAVREALVRSTFVEDFALGGHGEGGDGVTIVQVAGV